LGVVVCQASLVLLFTESGGKLIKSGTILYAPNVTTSDVYYLMEAEPGKRVTSYMHCVSIGEDRFTVFNSSE